MVARQVSNGRTLDMWHSFYSTGVRELDNDHDQIDSLLGDVSDASSAQEEQDCLMRVYCAIIDHIRFKFDLLGPQLSREEKDGDADFLGKVRQKIRQRNQGLVSRKELIAQLKQMLKEHAVQHQKSAGSSS